EKDSKDYYDNNCLDHSPFPYGVLWHGRVKIRIKNNKIDPRAEPSLKHGRAKISIQDWRN
ncbi:MAG: hypothetical protein EBR09_15455, partial [Proteobacteria bacterium]|nr:hypothetical protein [Pseudomonadota bacterium]